MAEAAEARGGDAEAEVAEGAEAPKKASKAKAKAKAPAKKAAKRTKEKVIPRRMLMWGVYNGNMKEEARFSFAERPAAEEKLGQLKEKSPKKLFFIQPIKVPLGDAGAKIVKEDAMDTDDEPPVKVAKKSADEEE
jgi:hypothetical protein